MVRKRETTTLANLEWLVRCRSQNQHATLALFKTLKKHSPRLKASGRLAHPGVILGAAAFSLWRAVFLEDGGSDHEDRFEDVLSFLETVIGDNAISYSHDKRCRGWMFNYYMNNARFRLELLSNLFPGVLPTFESPIEIIGTPADWEYLQNSLELGVGNYTSLLDSGKPLKGPAA